MFKGSIPALITPFKNGDIDWPAFEALVEWQIAQGSHAVVPCGTTGESPTLTHEEHMAIIKRCVEIVKKRIPVIAGTGSNATQEAIELTQYAQEVGADSALVVTPYYNKPSQDGMVAHFTALHDSVSLPLIVYNIPGRCIVDMTPQTMGRLAKLPRIVGVKDSSGDLGRPLQTAQECGKAFCQLSGDDITTPAFLAQGGHGAISVVANIAPALCAALYEAWQANDRTTFETLRDTLAPLAKDLFCESSPAPVKYAAYRLGLCQNEVRLPIIPLSAAGQDKVDKALHHAGLL